MFYFHICIHRGNAAVVGSFHLLESLRHCAPLCLTHSLLQSRPRIWLSRRYREAPPTCLSVICRDLKQAGLLGNGEIARCLAVIRVGYGLTDRIRPPHLTPPPHSIQNPPRQSLVWLCLTNWRRSDGVRQNLTSCDLRQLVRQGGADNCSRHNLDSNAALSWWQQMSKKMPNSPIF
jgi:hypothetical protein